MARFTILSWQEIPSLVEARDADGAHKVQLSQRFQELIDKAAMRRKLAGTDEYLTHWNKGRPRMRDGSAHEVAAAVAAELEARYETLRAEVLSK